MPTATMALAELAEKGADVDVLRQMVQFMAQRLMELDVELHQALGHELHHLAQHVDVGSLLGELGKCHSGGGHRVFPSDQGGWIAPQPYPGSRWPPRSGRPAAVRQAASGYALRASPHTERLTPLPGTSPVR